MNYTRRDYQPSDFLKINTFLKSTYRDFSRLQNWLIDRWNFCRYFTQVMHGTQESWPETVGVWVDERGEIAAVVNSEGENRGEAFFQLREPAYAPEVYLELIELAEERLCVRDGKGRFINLRVNEDQEGLKEILAGRGYARQDWRETISGMPIGGDFTPAFPESFSLADATSIDDGRKGTAHAKAFGYYDPDRDVTRRAYASLRMAPDYRAELDLCLMDGKGEIASFATVWCDDVNHIGILEPVGTIPEYRKRGLGKAVIYEGINRIKAKGATHLYVGSEQRFYFAIGFSVVCSKEIWQKRF